LKFRLSTFRPVKQYPEDRIVAEILEPMNFAGGSEEKIAGLEWLTTGAANVFAAPLNNNVDLIARMRLLGIDLLRRIYVDLQAAVRENCGECLTFGA